MAYLVQRLIVDARTEHRDGYGSTLRLQLARPALQQRCPISTRDEIHLVHEEKHGRLGRMLLQRIDAITVVRGVLDRVVRADLENVDQHADVLEDRRALGGQVRVHERVLTAAVPEVEDEVAQEAHVVLLDVDGRAEARGERGGIVRAVEWTRRRRLATRRA
jgi:hypothetical protein